MQNAHNSYIKYIIYKKNTQPCKKQQLGIKNIDSY